MNILRDDFESIEKEGILLSGSTTYAHDKERIKKKKNRLFKFRIFN